MKRIYLDGFDYTAALLNHDCRHTPGRGNHFLIALELDAPVTRGELEERLAVLKPLLPILSGVMRRHPLHAAPYWKEGKAVPVKITEQQERDPGNALNEPLEHALEVRICGGNVLAFRFSHLLFDGRGAELLIEALRTGNITGLTRKIGQDTPRLNEWGLQFRSGRQVQRTLISFAAAGGIAGAKYCPDAPNRCVRITLAQEEAAGLTRCSEERGGPFMMTPFLLAILCRHAAELLDRLKIPGNLLIPMSIDLRGRDGIGREECFFNQWGILPFLAPREIAASPEALLAELKGQLFEHTAQQLPQAYRAAARLARITPFSLLSAIVRRTGRTANGSFMFSFLSESSLKEPEFMGRRVLNLWHQPSMPPMTGCGIFLNSFQGNLNVLFSYREGCLPNPELRRFRNNVYADLKGTR